MGEAAGLCFVGTLVMGVILAVVWFNAVQEQRKKRLAAFAARLEGGDWGGGDSWLQGISSCWVRGRLEGRGIALEFDETGTGKYEQTWIVYKVLVKNVVSTMDVAKAGLVSRVGRWLGLVRDVKTGDARVDDKYIVRAGHNVGGAFQSGELERALDHLFATPGVDRVQALGGYVTVRRPFRSDALDVRALERMFKALSRVARLCERREVRVRVLGEKRQFAWTGGTDQALCPYCRDGIDSEDPNLSTCEHCNTVHHTECLNEAAGCTIFGCTGGAARTGQRTRG